MSQAPITFFEKVSSSYPAWEASRLEVLLVGSLRDGRWGLPKGRIEADEKKSKAAAEREAFEEAGVLGVADPEPLGSFFYFKDPTPQRYMVAVKCIR